MGRLSVIFGPPRDRTAEMLTVMAGEWHNALQGWQAARVTEAVSKIIASSKPFWWTCSEVVREIEALTPKPTRHHTAIAEDLEHRVFCRDGRTEAEEIAYREAQCAAWRRDHTPEAQETQVQETQVFAQTSQAQWVSPQLQAIAKACGYWRGSKDDAATSP